MNSVKTARICEGVMWTWSFFRCMSIGLALHRRSQKYTWLRCMKRDLRWGSALWNQITRNPMFCKNKKLNSKETRQGSANVSTIKEDSEPDSRKKQNRNKLKLKQKNNVKLKCKPQAGIWVATTTAGTWVLGQWGLLFMCLFLEVPIMSSDCVGCVKRCSSFSHQSYDYINKTEKGEGGWWKKVVRREKTADERQGQTSSMT